jgi:hypothetical protein
MDEEGYPKFLELFSASFGDKWGGGIRYRFEVLGIEMCLEM